MPGGEWSGQGPTEVSFCSTCSSTQCVVVLCCSMQCAVVLCCSMQCALVLRCSTQCAVVLCCSMQCAVVLHCSMQCVVQCGCVLDFQLLVMAGVRVCACMCVYTLPCDKYHTAGCCRRVVAVFGI